MVTRSILEPLSTSVDVVSPSGQTVLGLGDSSQSGSVVTTPPQTFHVHRHVQFRLGSPCERGWFNHEGHVVSGGVQDVYQHLGTQGNPARCKTLSEPSKEPESVHVFWQFHSCGFHSKTGRYPLSSSLQNDMGISPVLPSREHSPRSTTYTREAQHTGRSNKLVSTEWTLHMDVVQSVRDLWGSPTIDLFATKMNNRLPQYMSPLPDLKALAVNALAVSWDDMNAYTFLPTHLIQAVLNEVMTDKVRLCLISPCWPSQSWFRTLLELMTDHPRRLPEWDHLLWHPLGRAYHNSPFWQASCLETIRCLLWAKPFSDDTISSFSQSGLSAKLGVGQKGFIQSFPLFQS
jgi:hypothetical protein